jgi:hypothetical protein
MEKVRVQWLKSHPEFSYFAGDNSTLPADKAAILSKSGHINIFPGVEDKDVNTLPEDLPCREILFAAGFDSVEKVKEAGESLIDIKGIGKTSVKNILDFIG